MQLKLSILYEDCTRIAAAQISELFRTMHFVLIFKYPFIANVDANEKFAQAVIAFE